jgi:glyceraldehyde 3-phosphate dehydrogenase
MTTVHATTATQKTVDGPSNKDWRGGRGILENIIPSSTGAAKGRRKVIPELNKKLTAFVPCGRRRTFRVIDLTVELHKEATYEQICAAMKAASERSDEGRARLDDDKVVATDFRGERLHLGVRRRSRHRTRQHVRQGHCLYDNEWGYSSKVLEMARVISK